MIKNIIKILLFDHILSSLIIKRAKVIDKFCLTFDDGPHPIYTEKVLCILKKFSAVATFFLVGTNIERNKSLIEQIKSHGHQVCSHTRNHHELTWFSYQRVKEEVESVNQQLALSTNEQKFFRPPKGKFGFITIIYAILSKSKIILWSLDPKDYRATSPVEISRYFRTNPVMSGDIVLLHDKTPHTVEALEEILIIAQKKNLTPVTIAQLLTGCLNSNE